MTFDLSSAPEIARRPKWDSWQSIGRAIGKTIIAIWKYIAGVALCQNPIGSILVVGWTYRLAQRVILKHWWKNSSLGPENVSFPEFLQLSSYHRQQLHWPNWLLDQNRAWFLSWRTPGWAKPKAIFKSLFSSLWLNLKRGVQAVFNTWVLTMPACALMLFSWYAGWHNSFNKGYEQAIVGPLTGFAGIFLFIAAMYYVPLAQMRQASTGDWRSFYQFHTVWQLIRKRWLACFGLAVLYAALSVPAILILKTAPAFFPQINPNLIELPPDKALAFAKTYYFFAAFLVFAAFVLLRLVAARIYASSLVACVQSGAIAEDALAENEWQTLHRLDLLSLRPQRPRHILVRTITWFGTKLGRFTIGFAMFLVWFSFMAQVYVSEFLNRSEYGRGWLNQPLVQLPWFNYIPTSLENAAKEAGQKPQPTPALDAAK